MNSLFHITHPQATDAPAITALLQAYDLYISGTISTSEEEVANLLSSQSGQNSWGVVNEKQEYVGFAIVTGKPPLLPALMVLHPDWQHQGVENLLLPLMTAYADPYPETAICVSANTSYEEFFFSQAGFQPVRYWYEMGIQLRNRQPVVPDTLEIGTASLYTDGRNIHAAFEEVFSDHFDYRERSYKEFMERTQKPEFTEDLWFLLRDGEELAGFAFCTLSPDGKTAEITHFGMRRSWRGRGLAKVLLQYVFYKMQEAGCSQVKLSVDSDSLTHATKVYEAAGMQVLRKFVRYDYKTGSLTI
ncbi:GNAT family N-acetyltransferase [Ectobacillus ponti]|uniref:GNAT family N-acetyltransferase n=1 Tax=Ectobacillus ponti TaxID=2961894 RepID=A0AA41XB15_9BACI|nr:GNAT family N-acetyltransferase [Ectobacillus ponti]MCP8969563.1 GNAT family N-acetyltransferase [Ectobacillus ponti]